MTNPENWIDCPVCGDSYDTQAEADACRNWSLTEGGVVQLADGSYAYAEDVWDPSEEGNVESI
jgi:hypothetical protein